MTTTEIVKSACTYCGVGCGIVMEVADNRVVKVSGGKQHPTNFGRLSTKGNTCAQAIAESGRREHAYVQPERQRDPVRLGMAEKAYLQHRMLEYGAQLWSWLEEGAQFNVCGDASQMAKEVDAALKKVALIHGGLSLEAATAYIGQMAADKRYGRDVYWWQLQNRLREGSEV